MTDQISALVRGTDAFRRVDLGIADECWLNVLWLNDALPADRGLEIEYPQLPLRAALRALCREVEVYQPYSDGAIARPETLPYGNATFDLVSCYGRIPRRLELREYRRVIRPGGTALLGARNRWWIGRVRGAASSSVGALATLNEQVAILDAGFVDVRAYWVEPSLAVPRNLIPARPDRVRGFETVRACEVGKSVVRSLAVSVGLHQVIYPALVFVARG